MGGIAKARDSVLAESGRRLTRSQIAQFTAGDTSDMLQSVMDGPDPRNPDHVIEMSVLRCSTEGEANNPGEAPRHSDADDAVDSGILEAEYSDCATDESDLQDTEDNKFPEQTQACSQGRDELLDFVERHGSLHHS